jgi:hypothetical protein
MAIKIKRSTGDIAPASLAAGQLAYSEGATNGGTLYYGEIGGTVREIGGRKYVDKLNGIAAGAEVNTVDSVNGQTGTVVLDTTDLSDFNTAVDARITSTKLTAELGYTPENAANKGQANGYASLDSSGLVPSTQLPSYVDDVVEYTNLAGFPATGTTGKIFVAIDTGKTYRWSGSTYVEISASPGSTDSVTEGSTNLYYTDARARAAISAENNVSYEPSTGVITGPDISTVGFTGSYDDLIDKPTLFSGAFADLSSKPTSISGYGITDAFSGSYTDLTDKPTLFSGSYTDLTDKPSIPSIGDMRFNLNGANGTMDTSYAGDLTIKNGASYAIRLDVGSGGVLAQQNFSRITAYDSGTATTKTWEFKDDGKTYLPGFTLPATDGTANQVLSTNGSGTVSWSTVSAGGLSNVVEDTTPQLGGNLDVLTRKITTSTTDGNISLAPNGDGRVVIDGTDATDGIGILQVGDIVNTGTNALVLLSSAEITLESNTVVVGNENTNALITTYGTSDLVLNTNLGTSSGSITIADGANGNVTVTPNGTGSFVVAGANIGSRTNSTGGSVIGRVQTTTSGTYLYPGVNVQKARTDILTAAMTNEPAVIGFSTRDSASVNTNFGRLACTYQGSGTNPFFRFSQSADNFTTEVVSAIVGGGVALWGSAGTYTHTTTGTTDLIFSTNNGTNSGTIKINDGVNGNLELTPNGTGSVVIDGLSYPQADGTAGQLMTTNGSGQLSFTSDIDDGTF